jgi:IstB-like ATP binding protein
MKEVGVPFLEVAMVQVREVIRRWQAGEPPGAGVLVQLLQRNHAGPLPASVGPAAQVLTAQDERIASWLKDDLQLSRIHELLAGDGIPVSYTTLRRYVRQAGLWKRAETTVRAADWAPGEAAEIDFGRLGVLIDGTTGKNHVAWGSSWCCPPAGTASSGRCCGRRWRRASRADHSFEAVFRRYLAPDLLVLDDFGLHRLTPQQSEDLYALIIERHRRSSFIVTSNRDVSEWVRLFADPILANSALDRLANGAHQLIIEGPSYRRKLAPRPSLQEAPMP